MEEIRYEDFQKMDIRVARVVSAEPVPKTDRLLHLKLDVGESELRDVVAGIREFYEPHTLQGRMIVYLANLAPRKIRGIESRGMVLSAAEIDDNDRVTALSVLEACDPNNKVKAGADVC